MSKSKRLISLDFDGVIYPNLSPWKGPLNLPEEPVPGAFDFLRMITEHFSVAIFSERSCSIGGIDAMRGWLIARAQTENANRVKNGLGTYSTAWVAALEWPREKPPAFLIIDDRAVCFTGEWPTIDMVRNFVPWNRRPVADLKLDGG